MYSSLSDRSAFSIEIVDLVLAFFVFLVAFLIFFVALFLDLRGGSVRC